MLLLLQSKNTKKIRIFDPRAGTCVFVSIISEFLVESGVLMIFMAAGGVWPQWVEGVESSVVGRQ